MCPDYLRKLFAGKCNLSKCQAAGFKNANKNYLTEEAELTLSS